MSTKQEPALVAEARRRRCLGRGNSPTFARDGSVIICGRNGECGWVAPWIIDWCDEREARIAELEQQLAAELKRSEDAERTASRFRSIVESCRRCNDECYSRDRGPEE
jgi:hypothetical protein